MCHHKPQTSNQFIIDHGKMKWAKDNLTTKTKELKLKKKNMEMF
jgi:hypothetical protein